MNGHPGDQETPLITAASYGDPDVARVLIEAGADIEAVSTPSSGGVPSATALVMAADHQRPDVIDQIVAAGTPVNEPDAEWGRLPLHVAAQNGRLVSIRRLLTHGADPGLPDLAHQRTAFEYARDDTIEALLRAVGEGHR